jgi:hypothetical protein
MRKGGGLTPHRVFQEAAGLIGGKSNKKKKKAPKKKNESKAMPEGI